MQNLGFRRFPFLQCSILKWWLKLVFLPLLCDSGHMKFFVSLQKNVDFEPISLMFHDVEIVSTRIVPVKLFSAF